MYVYSGHVWWWELDSKEGRMPRNWCLWTVVLEKTPENPLDSKIKPVNLKGNQPWILLGRTDAKAETAVFWSSAGNSWLFGKDPDAGKDWGQKEKRVSEEAMAGLHHWRRGHKLGQTSGDGEGQRGLACCSPWGHKESDMTGQLNYSNNFHPRRGDKELGQQWWLLKRFLFVSPSSWLKSRGVSLGKLGGNISHPLPLAFWY